MDMSSSANSTSGGMVMMMMPYLHFGSGDFLLFKHWQPSSPGTIAGACIALFAFCILERGLAALRRTKELHWRSRALALVLKRQSSRTPSSDSAAFDQRKRDESADVVAVVEEALPSTELPSARIPLRTALRIIPPFILSHDILRGIIQAAQSMFSYVLMLAVMTFNAAYIITIVLGLGAGEILFGRIGHSQGGFIR